MTVVIMAVLSVVIIVMWVFTHVLV